MTPHPHPCPPEDPRRSRAIPAPVYTWSEPSAPPGSGGYMADYSIKMPHRAMLIVEFGGVGRVRAIGPTRAVWSAI